MNGAVRWMSKKRISRLGSLLTQKRSVLRVLMSERDGPFSENFVHPPGGLFNDPKISTCFTEFK